MHLSMCATRVANLWDTIVALSKLPSLAELRFQNCLCCDTRPCPICGAGMTISAFKKSYSDQWHQYSSTEETTSNVYFEGYSFRNHDLQDTIEESSDDSGMDISSNLQGIHDWPEVLHDGVLTLEGQSDVEIAVSPSEQTNLSSNTSVLTAFQLLEEVMYSSSRIEDCLVNSLEDPYSSRLYRHSSFGDPRYHLSGKGHHELCRRQALNSGYINGDSNFSQEEHISCHPSPICFEKCYREFMVYSLPHLKVLDNLLIKNSEREKAQVVFKKYFEYFPYNRQSKENIISILQKREMGHTTAFQKPLLSKQTYSRESCHSFSRSLSAAKVGSSPWPQMLSVSKLKSHSSEDTKMFRPRQFEYHPTNPSLMVFGTLDGELLVINHESQKLVGYLPSVGTLDSIIGLCWLKKYPSKLIAGSDNGSLQLYDICQMPSTVIDRYSSMDISRNTFDEFEQLTSVHINSTDEYFLASGFSKHVALYDISSGKRLQILKDLHQEHINVVKFAHYSPSIFATASFDRDVKMWDLRQGMKQPCFTATSLRGNVMACFSPDDHYLLTSAIDNEVKQLLAVDGRLHTEFHIAPTGSSQNYTRSYYMNGKDYIISGSCEENSVRICCAQTGRRFRDLPLESGGPGFSMFVQSLRGDPFRMFHMSILAAYLHPCTKSEIIKVNLLASSDSAEEDSYAQCLHAPSGMGS